MIPSSLLEAQKQKEIDFIFISNLFPETKSNEMKISFELWATKLFINAGLNYKINLKIIDRNNFEQKKYDTNSCYMVVLSSIIYLQTKDDRRLEPILITYEDNSQAYVIVTKKNITELNDLRNHKLAITDVGFGEIAEFWLNSIMQKEYNQDKSNFFKKVNYLDSESRCVNSVFFSKDDACVVREDVYNLTCELNPQIRNKTHIIRKSVNLLHSVFCLTGKFTPEEKKRFISSVFKIQETPDGEQIMNLFKRTKLIEFKQEYLENIEELINK